MKYSFASLGLGLGLLSLPAFGLEINCIKDQRAVDGDMTSVQLKVDDKGNGTALLMHQGDSRAVSFSETVTLRALKCTDSSSFELKVDCTGINKLNVSERELVKPGNSGFMRQVHITTAYKNRSFIFNRGNIGKDPIKNGCDYKK